MKHFGKAVFIALALLLFMNYLAGQKPAEQKPPAQDKTAALKQTQKLREKPAAQPDRERQFAKLERGSIYLYQLRKLLSQRTVQGRLAYSHGRDNSVTYHLNGWQQHPERAFVFASAPNTRNTHQIVNSFLVGYAPFRTDNIWIPLMTLSQRKAYQFDHLQFGGRKDVWQTSRESFTSPRGDCEDHAIALADWLIEMGEDARVVMGDYKGRGHAWVILFKDGKEFLLEATWKLNGRTLKRYPLASMYPDYHPDYMFNRTDFWVNLGSKRTTDYSSLHWVKKSRYN